MTKRFVLNVVIVTAIGFCVGALFLMSGMKCLEYPRAKTLFDTIHAPAFWFAHQWTYKLRLPPQNEAAIATVPIAAVVLQWTLLGFLIGLWRGFRSCRTLKGPPENEP